jgi:hypothetical protein
VDFDGVLRCSQDCGDFGIGFALRHPEKHFGFARGEAESLKWGSELKSGLKPRCA